MVRETTDEKEDAAGRTAGLNWNWLRSRPIARETKHVCHVRLENPLILKVNGHTSESVVLEA
jgi:hypothetical protein